MIASGLRDFTQESYFGSPGLVYLNIALVAVSFARTQSSALQSWSVKPVNSKLPSRAQMQFPSSHPMTIYFGSIGAGSNEWPRDQSPNALVSTGVKST